MLKLVKIDAVFIGELSGRMKFIFVPCRNKNYIDRKCYEID